MFGEWEWDEETGQLQSDLAACEAEIGRLRARQVELIRRLDRCQVDTAEGARTLGEWASARLDLSPQTAGRLTLLARADDREVESGLAAGRFGIDRAALLVKLRQTGAPPELIAEAADSYSLGRLYGLVLQRRQISAGDEQASFESRFLVIQPSLDEQMFKLWGLLPATDGQIVEKALHQKETGLPVLPGEGQGQRRVDALTAICLDSLTGGSEESNGTDRTVTVAEIFVDGHLAAESRGEKGATISSGLRVGPTTLSEILCHGRIRVIYTDGHGPISVSHLSEAIPPGIRSYVLWRDQGHCSIEGCRSRYRLQPHHIQEQQHDGDHHPENLVSFVLVPPSCRHPPTRLPDRPQLTHPPKTAHPTRRATSAWALAWLPKFRPSTSVQHPLGTPAPPIQGRFLNPGWSSRGIGR